MKGQIQIKFIAIVLAVFVLVLVVLFLYKSGVLEKIGLIIPGLNSTKEPLKVDGLVGYNLESGKIEFYDGIKWYELKDKVDFDGKVITRESLEKDLLSDFYFRSGLRGQYVYRVDEEIIKKIYLDYPFVATTFGGGRRIPALDVCFVTIETIDSGVYFEYDISIGEGQRSLLTSERGATIMRLVEKSEPIERNCFGKKSFGDVRLGRTGELLIRKINSELNLESQYTALEDPILLQEFEKIADDWKFSVLEKPVTIRFTEEGIENSLRVCVENSRGERLIADLSKEAGESC